MAELAGFIFFIVSLLGGALLVAGAHLRWAWLIDPPDHAWGFYSQAFIKRVAGRTALLYFIYMLGVSLILVGLRGLWLGFH